MLLGQLAALGATVRTRGDRLRIETAAELPANLLAEVRARKADLLPLARQLELSLQDFARVGRPLEIRVSWWPETLFLVPDVRHAEDLWRAGVARERLWTASELLMLCGDALVTPETLRIIMVARREFRGEVVASHL